jgi:hypothetical protein
MSRHGLLVLLLLGVLPSSATGGEGGPAPSVLGVGSRVRVSAPSVFDGRVQGLVVSTDAENLTLAVSDGPLVTLPRNAITRLDVFLGHRRRPGRGALFGSLAGMALLAAAPVDPGNCGPSSASFCSRGEAVAAGALTGALVGFVIGAVHPADRWGIIPLDGWRIAVRATPRGGAVVFSFGS